VPLPRLSPVVRPNVPIAQSCALIHPESFGCFLKRRATRDGVRSMSRYVRVTGQTVNLSSRGQLGSLRVCANCQPRSNCGIPITQEMLFRNGGEGNPRGETHGLRRKSLTILRETKTRAFFSWGSLHRASRPRPTVLPRERGRPGRSTCRCAGCFTTAMQPCERDQTRRSAPAISASTAGRVPTRATTTSTPPRRPDRTTC
jgi:hypothetical protein